MPAILLLPILRCSAVLVFTGGTGPHVEVGVITNPSALATENKLVYALSWTHSVSNMLSRASVVALYLRIFPKGMTRLSSWVVLFYLMGLLIAQVITGILQCRPIQSFWDRNIPGAKCINLILYWRLSTVLNVIGDVIIMIIPIYRIWTLHASTARKAGIALAFISGSL